MYLRLILYSTLWFAIHNILSICEYAIMTLRLVDGTPAVKPRIFIEQNILNLAINI